MAEGCKEKFDLEFMFWILWTGRTKERRERFVQLQRKYPEKVTVLKNQRQLDTYYQRFL